MQSSITEGLIEGYSFILPFFFALIIFYYLILGMFHLTGLRHTIIGETLFGIRKRPIKTQIYELLAQKDCIKCGSYFQEKSEKFCDECGTKRNYEKVFS